MAGSDQFGELVTADEVEDAIVTTLQTWFASYAGELERRKERAPQEIPLPRSWQVRPDMERWPEEQIPAMLVVSAGTDPEIMKHSGGVHDASFAISVGHFVASPTERACQRLNRWYAALVRQILLQKAPRVQGVAVDVAWRGESYDGGPISSTRTVGIGSNVFLVGVDHVVESDAGPIEPVVAPYDPDGLPDDPTADEVFVAGDKL